MLKDGTIDAQEQLIEEKHYKVFTNSIYIEGKNAC
jgi:hypothetical protein